MVEIDLIIFDFDGTLLDSKKVIVNAANYTLNELGLKSKSGDWIIGHVGTSIRGFLKRIPGLEDISKVEKGVELFTRYWNNNLVEESRLFPNIKVVLEHFRDKSMFIISNGSMMVIEKALKKFKIKKYFQKVISGDDEDCLKPSTCPIDKAINIRDIRQKERTIIVGDMVVDIKTGKEAGIKTCGVTYGLGKADEIKASKPDFLINDILELMEVIK